MKVIGMCLAMVFLSSSAAFAGNAPLTGNDAVEMVQILKSAGIGSVRTDNGTTFVEAFDVMCEGADFHDRCFASRQNVDPASSRVDIIDPSAGKLWGLLIRMGHQNFVSDVADGTAGKTMITAGAIRCTLTPSSHFARCTSDAR